MGSTSMLFLRIKKGIYSSCLEYANLTVKDSLSLYRIYKNYEHVVQVLEDCNIRTDGMKLCYKCNGESSS